MSDMNDKKTKATNESAKQPPYMLIAGGFGVIMIVGIVMAFMNFKTVYGNGLLAVNRAPLVVALVLTVVGAAGLSTAIALSIRVLLRYGRELDKARENFSVDPSVLRDPRIRELPEVKKLMKNENVKRIFEAEKISAGDLSDPHVQLLIEALLKHADENGVIRFE